jgi:hypothetical protein
MGGAPQSPPASATSWAPTAKVAAGPLAGGISLIVTTALTAYGVKWVTPAVGGAITTIITFVIQYMTPERTG